MADKNKKIILSGVQPTGRITLGNYLGAIKNWVENGQNDSNNSLFCIVDLHSITVPQNPEELKQNIIRVAATYIAAGLDPDKVSIFQQSQVSEHLELSWVFECITPIGWLNRMTQFKDKVGKNQEKASLGLYGYPVLMAADILIYHAESVPVGEDQTQHVELARDIAALFNRKFGVDYFKLPNIEINKSSARIMSLRDGTKKMSKSDASDTSRINLTDDTDLISQKIKKAKTDSITEIYHDTEKRPEISNLINIYCSLEKCSIKEAEKDFNGFSTSQFKDAIIESLINHITPIGEKILSIEKEKEYLLSVLKNGREVAKSIASKTVSDVYKIVGFRN